MKKLLFIVLFSALMAAGCSLKNSKEKQIVENSTPAPVISQTETPAVVTSTIVSSTPESTLLDCGLSDQGKIGELVYEKNGETFSISDFSKDESLKCMGQALLNNCQKAIIKIKSKNGTIHTEEIVGGDSENCSLKVTYQGVNNADVDEKQYENSYLQCDYPRARVNNPDCPGLSKDACDFFGIKKSPAYIYSNSVGSMFLAAIFSPEEAKCSGNMKIK
jgi:hypothetical protein